MKIYVWGTGCGASEALERGLPLSNITAFIDSTPLCENFMGLPVLKPEALQGLQPDLILVASRHAEEIGNRCHELGISDDRILYLKDYHSLQDRNRSCRIAQELLGTELLEQLLPPQHIVTAPSSLYTPRLRTGNDYVRVSTLELLTRRLKEIPGAMAELGVYQGGFSSCMNRLMPERTLYLFDTFSGFDAEEGRAEKGRNTCHDGFLEAHRNTAAEMVLKKMPFPEHVIPKPGLFPGSLRGLEDRFCLVSLDADFRDSTLEGLRYFWPRMNEGGYLMLHDWGCPRLTGVAEAVTLYEAEIGCRLPSIPIPDIGNSLIITKVSQY